jgi:hypothetical protein
MATAKAKKGACASYSKKPFEAVAISSPGCAAAALALKLPSAAAATNTCYQAGEGEVCVVSIPKKNESGSPTYGVICASADAKPAAAGAPAAAATSGGGGAAARAGAAAAVAAAAVVAVAMF